MPSFLARIVTLILPFVANRRVLESEGSLLKALKKGRPKPLSQPTARLRRRLQITSRMLDGHEIATLTPKADKGLRQVLYVHGGAYIQDLVPLHWGFSGAMAEKLSCKFIAPRYPLAPEHDVQQTMEFMTQLYWQIIQTDPHTPLIVMGDSAGGGLALALLQEVNKRGWPMPDKLILISPWLDATMTAPEQEEIEQRDPVLMREGLRVAGKWYAGSLSTAHPWVSPINGTLEGLPPILMFGGDRDILVTDARALSSHAKLVGHPLEYQEEAGLLHAWPLVPLRESKAAWERIKTFLDN
jgi:monoterpene epsilon-lactone hydrolase